MTERALAGRWPAVWGLAVVASLSAASCRSKTTPEPDAAAVAPSVSAAPSTSPRAVENGSGTADGGEARGKVAEAPANALPDDPAKGFVANRIANGKIGATEIVSLRVWHCGPSCTCPPPCIETVNEETGQRWVDLHDDGGEVVALADWANADVTGWFTGRTRTITFPEGGDRVEIPELRLTSTPTIVSTSMGPELEGAHARIVLDGPPAKKFVSRVKDGKPWLVVAGAFPLAFPERADADASALFEKLDKLGIKDAERHDSRAFAGLACCFEVVLGGRFADAKSADARVRQLAAKGVKTYAKKGF